MKITEQIAIKKEDSTLSKLIKFCVWIGIIFCFLIFAIIWIIFFILLGGPTCIYKLFSAIHKHHEYKTSAKIARREIKENEIW